MKIVVLAGGVGQRLWPLSREISPKQIQPVIGDHTLLQTTINRLLKKFKASDIFIVTGKEYFKNISRQLPGFHRKNILMEPARKNTAAAIGYAAYLIAKKNPKETIISIASDHFVYPEEIFLRSLKNMEKVIKKDPLGVCLLGIKPSYPATGLGYIKVGPNKKLVAGVKLHEVNKFVEKPSLKKAEYLTTSGKYLWNPSYFAWRVDNIQRLYKKFIPKTHKLLEQTIKGNKKAFDEIIPLSIDYAILEKLKNNFYVIPANFTWADIGHWATIKEIHAKKSKRNVILGLQHSLDTESSLIYNYTNNVLTTVGVKDLIIVQTKDGTLVCHKDRAQDVKTLVEQMSKEKHLRKFL